MRLLARFHRWRLATTKYWLPYERQLHSVLLADHRLSSIRNILAGQIATLFKAYRSRNTSELTATYSYRCSQFFDVTDEFTLCSIRASNAEGVIRFGGGMLSEIRLRPTIPAVNPIRFQLEGITLDQIYIPHVAASPKPTGWVAELETDGLIRQYKLIRRRFGSTENYSLNVLRLTSFVRPSRSILFRRTTRLLRMHSVLTRGFQYSIFENWADWQSRRVIRVVWLYP
jgi:hypothetical protein